MLLVWTQIRTGSHWLRDDGEDIMEISEFPEDEIEQAVFFGGYAWAVMQTFQKCMEPLASAGDEDWIDAQKILKDCLEQAPTHVARLGEIIELENMLNG
jgi:hypothetical protein